MRTRPPYLYSTYALGRQYSQREREHFDNAWQLQSIIPERLNGNEFDWVDSIWMQYVRTPSGGFTLLYTVFDYFGRYQMYFQNVTRLDMIEEVILFLQKNLTRKNNDTN